MSLFTNLISSFSNASKLVATANNFNNSLSANVNNITRLVNTSSSIGQTFSNKSSSLNLAGIQNANQAFNSRIPVLSDFNNFSNAISILPNGVNNIVSSISDVSSAISDIKSGNVAGAFNTVINSPIGNLIPGVPQIGNALNQLDNVVNNFSNFGLNFGAFGSGTISSLLGTTGIGSASSITKSKLPNPLRDYASYNYHIALGCLSKNEVNTPSSTYRNRGLSNIIVQSAGGTAGRVTTATEDTYGAHAEYFIDDLEIETVLTPNNITGPVTGTVIRFVVTEPYSMGQFIETIAIAAEQNKYTTYNEACYCLEVKFAGWDDSGNDAGNLGSPSKFIPFRFTNMNFSVTGEGCVYEVEAVPFNEQATFDENVTLKQDTTIEGRTIADILQNEKDRSLTEIINQRLKTQEEQGVVEQHHKYIICFPNDKQGVVRAVDSGNRDYVGYGAGQVDPGLANAAGITLSDPTSSSSVFDGLKAYAQLEINDIGKKVIVEDVFEEGDRPIAEADAAMDPDKLLIFSRNDESMQMSDFLRKIQYTNGDDIVSIISDVITNSQYGRELAEKPAVNGKKEWFKIETFTFLEPNQSSEQKLGTDPKVYVYAVLPYYVDEAIFLGPDRRPSNSQALAGMAQKTYNYLYTGENEDVLDFDIEYNFAFFQNLNADLNQLGGERRAGASIETVNPGKQDNTQIARESQGFGSKSSPRESNNTLQETNVKGYTAKGGRRNSESFSTKVGIAQSFHNSLMNSNVDLIQGNLKIWGDPYFIPTSGMGNYNAAPAAPFVTTDGTIDYQNSEVFIIINFKIPFDYNQDGTMQFSKLVKQFSGLYKVLGVNNKFSDGQFIQDLQILRRRGQNDNPTGETENIVLSQEVDLSEGDNNSFSGAGGPVGTNPYATGYGAAGSALAAGQSGALAATSATAELEPFGGAGPPIVPSGSNTLTVTSQSQANSIFQNPNSTTEEREAAQEFYRTGVSTPVVPAGSTTGTGTGEVEYVSGFSGKIRNQTIQPSLNSIIQSAARTAGVNLLITSGGQTSTRRTGSHRHDDGYAVDVQLRVPDRSSPLSTTNPDDLSIIQTFIRAAEGAGATGIGAGNGYMGNNTFHVDIADDNTLKPGMKGYDVPSWGTSSATNDGAPQWLKGIMGG